MCIGGGKQPDPPTNPAPYSLENSDQAVIETSHATQPPAERTADQPKTEINAPVTNTGAGVSPYRL